MKKLFVLMLALVVFDCAGQQVDYFANNPIWRQNSTCAVLYPCLEDQEFIYYIHSDTVINTNTYHVIYKLADVSQSWMAPPPSNGCGGSWTTDQLAAIVRQDGKKIYIHDGNQDQLLYDFELEVGDTLPQTYNNWHDNLVITSIDSFQVGNSYRMLFQIGNENLYLAEGIGHDEGFLEPFPPYLECGYELNCFTLNGTTYFPDQQTECDLTVDISVFNSQTEAQVYPNPTNGSVSIDIGQTVGSVEISIYDSTGQLVKLQRTASQKLPELDIPTVNGVYIINLQYPDGTRDVMKVIKE